MEQTPIRNLEREKLNGNVKGRQKKADTTFRRFPRRATPTKYIGTGYEQAPRASEELGVYMLGCLRVRMDTE